jgi:hypothetical protein
MYKFDIPAFCYEEVSTKVTLFNIDLEYKQQIIGYLLPIILSSAFYSITQSDDEFSFFIDIEQAETIKNALKKLRIGYNHMPEVYQIIRLYEDSHKINEHGIVAQISDYFAKQNIPILYINSFNNNFVLYPSLKND